jgi:hypothetical protein
MGWIKGGRYYQYSIREGATVKNCYLGSAARSQTGLIVRALIDEHEAEVRDRHERRQAIKAQRKKHVEEFERAKGRLELVETIGTAMLRALGFRLYQRRKWRRRMIQIEHGGDRVKEAREIMKILKHGKPSEENMRGLLARLKELAKVDPASVLKAHPGGEFHSLCVGIITDTMRDAAPDLGYQIEARLNLLITELLGDKPNPALRVAAELVGYAYFEHWLSNIVVANGISSGPVTVSPGLERRQTFTQKRLLRALKCVEEIRQLTKPRRIATMEVIG